MTKNLWSKTALIVAVLLVFLFGIFGVPKSVSGEGLKTAILDRIHLGLDLKGGTHLILQVQVDDAIRAESARVVERLKDQLKRANVAFADISVPDPQGHPDRVAIKGVPPEVSGELRRVVSDNMADWDLASGPENSWTVTMKPQSATALKNQAVTQAIETIRNRI